MAGELLKKAEELLKIGMHPSEIVEGYEKAFSKAIELLDTLIIKTVGSLTESELKEPVNTAIASKQYGMESFLTRLIIQASLAVMPKNPKLFNVDSIRVVKILGGSIMDSSVVHGMVFGRQADSKCVMTSALHVDSLCCLCGRVCGCTCVLMCACVGQLKNVTDAKIAVYSCPLDIGQTETKGTVLIHDAKELLSFSKGEEKLLEKQFQEIANSGANVLVTGGAIGELALHFINRFHLMAIKVPSKFDLQRLCRVTGATTIARLVSYLLQCDQIDLIESNEDRYEAKRLGIR